MTHTQKQTKQFSSLCRGQGLLQKCIWHAFKMHANTFKLCITDLVLFPAVWTDYEKIAQKLLGLVLVLGISLVCPFTLGPGSSFGNQVYNGIAIKKGLIPCHYCGHEIEVIPVRIKLVHWWHVRTKIIHQDYDQGDYTLALTREVYLATTSSAPSAE